MTSSMSKDEKLKQVIACHECDLLMPYPDLTEGEQAICPRCGFILTTQHKNAMNRIMAFSASGLIFLLLSSLYPFLSFSVRGQERVVSLLQSIDILVAEQQLVLALLIMVAIIIIPAAFLIGVLYVFVNLSYFGKLPMYGKNVLRFILTMVQWSMVEIFLIGMMVSLVKVSSLADIGLGLSFWSYIMFTVFMTLVLMHIDKVQMWQWVDDGDDKATV